MAKAWPVNHCTMEECALAKVADKPIDHCRGRYNLMPEPPISPAKANVAATGRVLDACDFPAIRRQLKILSAPPSDAKARALLARMKRVDEAQANLEEARKMLAEGNLSNAKSKIRKLKATPCTGKDLINNLGKEIEGLERVLAEADDALRTCAASRMTTASRRLVRKGDGSWEGPYVTHKDVPLQGITHYITRDVAP